MRQLAHSTVVHMAFVLMLGVALILHVALWLTCSSYRRRDA